MRIADSLSTPIPFTRFELGSLEKSLPLEATESPNLRADGAFNQAAEALLAARFHAAFPMLTSSGSGSLEIVARLIRGPETEVIVPSFAFPTCATAFAATGAQIKFADIDPENLMLSTEAVAERVTAKTTAVVLINYGGFTPPPASLIAFTRKNDLLLIEDNAHGIGSSYHDQPLGTFGALSSLSFHSTKNVSCGEGGALVVNNQEYLKRAFYLRDKGTNRRDFNQGIVDSYTMRELGSNFLLPELSAAVLSAQLNRLEEITSQRVRHWELYSSSLQQWATRLGIRVPTLAPGMKSNGHIFFLRMPTLEMRQRLQDHLSARQITAVTHYRTLHDTPLGEFLDPGAVCPRSSDASDLVLRLPLFQGMTTEQGARVIDACLTFRG